MIEFGAKLCVILLRIFIFAHFIEDIFVFDYYLLIFDIAFLDFGYEFDGIEIALS